MFDFVLIKFDPRFTARLQSKWKKYQKELFDEPNIVTAADIAKNQDKMLCAFSFWNFEIKTTNIKQTRSSETLG